MLAAPGYSRRRMARRAKPAQTAIAISGTCTRRQPASLRGDRAGHDPTVIAEKDEGPHRADLLRGERSRPESDGDDRPARCAAAQPSIAAQQRGQEKDRAQQFGPAADIADRFGHHRVDGEQCGARERRADPPSRDPAAEHEQQRDVEHVEQHVRDVIAERIRPPHGMIDRVRQVDHRPRHVVQDDRPNVGGMQQRRVADDRVIVVVHVRVVQRVQVREGGQQHRRAAGQRCTPIGSRSHRSL